MKRIHKTDTIVWQPGSGRPRIRRIAVENLVLSQVDKPRHWSACEISHETAILRSSVRRIIHRDLQLKYFIRSYTQLLSEATRITRLTRW